MAANKDTSQSGHWRHAKGRPRSKTYNSWARMKSRCLNKNDHNYRRYGARGISVCERWLKFENFLADMGERPEGTTLDRIDSDGNYEPNNCRWADSHTQFSTNLRRKLRIGSYKVFLTAFGETKGLMAWLQDPRCSVKKVTLRARVRKGWPDQRAVSEPPSETKQRAAEIARPKRWPVPG